MVEFLLRLLCIIPIHLLLTRIGYNFTNNNVAAFITDCGALVIHILILLVPGKAYLKFICTFFIAVSIVATQMDYIPVVEMMYSQGFIAYVFACQLLICLLRDDKRMNKVLMALLPIFLDISASLCWKHYYLCFIVAFCFFIAGYALDINEELQQSLRDIQQMVSQKGFIQTIEHLYANRQIGWIWKVLWSIMFIDTIYTYFNESDKWVLYIFAASNSMLQHFLFSLLLLDASFIILWLVQAILKWSVRHTVDEFEASLLGERRKVKDAVLLIFATSCILSLCITYFFKETHESLYFVAALVNIGCSCIATSWFALLLCNENLQTLSISWGTIWAHVRAVVLTISLLLLFTFVTLSSKPNSVFVSEIVEWCYFISWTVAAIMQTIKMLTVYMLYVFDFLLPNGIEQVEEKVYKFNFIADIFAIVWAILVFGTIVWDQSGIKMHFSIAIVAAILLFILATSLNVWCFWLERCLDELPLQLIGLADATMEQLKMHKDQDGRCSVCSKIMSSAKITPCGHIFHPSCLRRLLKHGTSTCPECREPITSDNAGAGLEQEITLTKLIHEDEKYNWFKDKFLDSRRKLKKEIYHQLKSFPWLCGAYGLTAANKIIARPHLFLTVKKEVNHGKVFRQLQETFGCDDPDEYFELLDEPERKPNFKRLGRRYENNSSVVSEPSTPDASVEAVPGGRVLVCSDGDFNPMRVPEEIDGVNVLGSGTLTMFCCEDEQHYALICSHVGFITDARRAQAAFNQEECIREIRGSFSYYQENAKKHKYYFEDGREQNDNMPISLDDEESKCKLLGFFDNCHFDDECDILSVKISDEININCKVKDVPPPDWVEIWNELYERVIEKPDPDLVEVVKISLSPTCLEGRIVTTQFSYKDGEDDLFYDTTVVKGDRGSFLHDGDSGSLVCFLDKKKEKKVFAYGVLEVDQLSLPGQHEQSTSTGPYAICLSLERSLEKLGFGKSGCFNVCGGNSKPSSVSKTGNDELRSTSSRRSDCGIQ